MTIINPRIFIFLLLMSLIHVDMDGVAARGAATDIPKIGDLINFEGDNKTDWMIWSVGKVLDLSDEDDAKIFNGIVLKFKYLGSEHITWTFVDRQNRNPRIVPQTGSTKLTGEGEFVQVRGLVARTQKGGFRYRCFNISTEHRLACTAYSILAKKAGMKTPQFMFSHNNRKITSDLEKVGNYECANVCLMSDTLYFSQHAMATRIAILKEKNPGVDYKVLKFGDRGFDEIVDLPVVIPEKTTSEEKRKAEQPVTDHSERAVFKRFREFIAKEKNKDAISKFMTQYVFTEES